MQEEREEARMICREHGRKYRFDRFQTHITELKAAWKLKGTRSS